jgi:hypothetical protein
VDIGEKAAFIFGYTRILTQAWSSEEFSRRLETDPQVVLAENGLPITPGARVEIIRSRDADPDLDTQVHLWDRGSVTGRYVLYVPHLPQVDTRELDDDELGDLAGGVSGYCCTPCCCQSV